MAEGTRWGLEESDPWEWLQKLCDEVLGCLEQCWNWKVLEPLGLVEHKQRDEFVTCERLRPGRKI